MSDERHRLNPRRTQPKNELVPDRLFFPPPVRWSPWVAVLLGMAALAALLPLVFYLYFGAVQRNLALTVGPTGLTVDFRVGRIDIPVDDISDVAFVASPPRMRRVGGAGLAGLQMGWYRMDDYGRVYRLTTAGGPVVYVDTHPASRWARPDTRYVFSPEDADDFVELLRVVRGGGYSGRAVTFRSVPAPSVAADPVLLLALIVTAPLAIAMPYVLRKGKTGMRYQVGPSGIAVHYLGKRSYRWSSIVDVRRLDAPLPRMWRVIGVSMPGYYTGTFTAGELGSVNVYATRLEAPLVLVETRLGKVVISPEDVDGFLAAVAEYRPDSVG